MLLGNVDPDGYCAGLRALLDAGRPEGARHA